MHFECEDLVTHPRLDATASTPVKYDDPTRENEAVQERGPGQEDDAPNPPDDQHTQY